MKTIAVIIPIFNEEDVLPQLFDRLKNLIPRRPDVEWHFIFVNDGSTDRSCELLDRFAEENPNVSRVIHLSRNFGHQMAISAGIDYSDEDIVCLIDGDLQDPPELLLEMINEVENGFNIVYGQRIRRMGESWFKLTSASLCYRLINNISKVNIPVDTGDFRAMDRKVVDTLKSLREYHRFIRGMVAWAGFRSQPLPYNREMRPAGKTKYTFLKMLNFAKDAIFSFSNLPLRIANYLGLTITLFSLMGIFYIVIQLIFFNNYLPGVSATLLAVLLIGGIQLISLGIIGEYISRIYEQTKNRPLYIIRDLRNFSSLKNQVQDTKVEK